MKKSLLFFFIIIINFSLRAKDLVAGYYINLNNDTIHVVFKISTIDFGTEPNLEYLQKSIAIIDSNNKKEILMPFMAKQFSFDFNGKIYTMYAACLYCENNLNEIFLQRKKTGVLNLYLQLKTVSSGGFSGGGFGGYGGGFSAPTYIAGSSSTIEHYILQKNNQPLYNITRAFFKHDMKLYFEDCPFLLKKIKEDEFRFEDIETIVDFYNTNCL